MRKRRLINEKVLKENFDFRKNMRTTFQTIVPFVRRMSLIKVLVKYQTFLVEYFCLKVGKV